MFDEMALSCSKSALPRQMSIYVVPATVSCRDQPNRSSVQAQSSSMGQTLEATSLHPLGSDSPPYCKLTSRYSSCLRLSLSPSLLCHGQFSRSGHHTKHVRGCLLAKQAIAANTLKQLGGESEGDGQQGDHAFGACADIRLQMTSLKRKLGGPSDVEATIDSFPTVI